MGVVQPQDDTQNSTAGWQERRNMALEALEFKLEECPEDRVAEKEKLEDEAGCADGSELGERNGERGAP
ncbi:hypothetical protein AB1Y20_014992 [Prymnesium parvum]|uniref:Uncharacterized protein n=1 Tax=Prymnesium parvum TaxID=97485 RepID=A0AB34JVG4_PRYPA